jgi:hypothetical protein
MNPTAAMLVVRPLHRVQFVERLLEHGPRPRDVGDGVRCLVEVEALVKSAVELRARNVRRCDV